MLIIEALTPSGVYRGYHTAYITFDEETRPERKQVDVNMLTKLFDFDKDISLNWGRMKLNWVLSIQRYILKVKKISAIFGMGYYYTLFLNFKFSIYYEMFLNVFNVGAHKHQTHSLSNLQKNCHKKAKKFKRKKKRGIVSFMECFANKEPRSTGGGGAYIRGPSNPVATK